MKLGTVELDGLGVSYKDDELKMVWRLDNAGRMELVCPRKEMLVGRMAIALLIFGDCVYV